MDMEHRVWTGAIQTLEKRLLCTCANVLLLSYYTRALEKPTKESFANWSTKSLSCGACSIPEWMVCFSHLQSRNNDCFNMPIMMAVVSNDCKFWQNFSGCNYLLCGRFIWWFDYCTFTFRKIDRPLIGSYIKKILRKYHTCSFWWKKLIWRWIRNTELMFHHFFLLLLWRQFPERN